MKNRSNEIRSNEIRSNEIPIDEICSNEIRIRQELPVHITRELDVQIWTEFRHSGYGEAGKEP